MQFKKNCGALGTRMESPRHKHKHKKNGHVCCSCVYAYAYAYSTVISSKCKVHTNSLRDS